MLLSALSVLMDGKCIVCSDIISISHPLPLMCKSNEQTKFKGGFMRHLLLSVPRSINCSSLVSAASCILMLSLYLLPLVLASVLATPGAPWSEEEALIVKSKLYSLFWNPSWASAWYLERHPELGITEWPEKKSFPHAPKMLR